jgi:hypothetical protein
MGNVEKVNNLLNISSSQSFRLPSLHLPGWNEENFTEFQPRVSARVSHSTHKFGDCHVEFKDPTDVLLPTLLAISEKRFYDCPQSL